MKIFAKITQNSKHNIVITTNLFLCCISIVSFMIGILFYNHYYTSRSHIIVAFNYSDPIESALLNIPICTSIDRARQRALLVTLQKWTRLARQFHIQYWIAYGTLVGYVQRRGLLPHDRDVDILIMGQNTIQLVRLAENLSWFVDSNIYKLVIHPQWFIVKWENRSYYPSQDINFIAPNARFVNQQDRLYVDIWPIYDYHPDQSNNTTEKTPMLTEIDANYKWKSSPKYWTFPLRPCYLSGIRVWCPAEPEEIVCTIYEESALRKSDTMCVNGSWV